MKLLDTIKKFLDSGNSRSAKAKKNIVAMLFIKGGNIFIGFLLVPLTIAYVDSDTYGVWIAISSIVSWFSFCDIGLGNGLKNNLTEALAVGNITLGRKYVSTTYALMVLIFIPLMVLLLLVVPILNWGTILNTDSIDVGELQKSISILIAYFCINSIFSLINIILQADQRPADGALRSLIEQFISLIAIFVLTKITQGNLTKLCIALCACPLFVIIFFNLTLFSKKYQNIAPSLNFVDFSLAPNLFKLGVSFFIIQIAGIIQYQMTNFLIIHYYCPGDVTSYNVAYKLFNAIYMVWMILMTPIWSAVTDALVKGDKEWIRQTVKKYLTLYILFAAGSLVLLAVSGSIYHIWVGNSVIVPFSISLWVMLYNLAMMLASVFVLVLNGASIIKVQAIASCISPVIFLGCFFLLKNNGLGVEAIMISSIIANFNGLLLAPIQYFKLFYSNKRDLRKG